MDICRCCYDDLKPSYSSSYMFEMSEMLKAPCLLLFSLVDCTGDSVGDGYNTTNSYGQTQVLEDENEQKEGELHAKVKALKSVRILRFFMCSQ